MQIALDAGIVSLRTVWFKMFRHKSQKSVLFLSNCILEIVGCVRVISRLYEDKVPPSHDSR